MIDKAIPIPPRRHNTRANAIADALEIGDSTLVPSEGQANTLRQALAKLGRKCTWRKVEGGWRVWRTT